MPHPHPTPHDAPRSRPANKRRRLKYAAISLGCVSLITWILFFANWPARQVGQLTLAPPGGAPLPITLWVADPLVELPFTTNSAWVRCGTKRWKLHGRGFGSGVGRVAVSPDGTQAVVHSRFEGGEFPAVLIDLRSAEMRWVSRWSDYEAMGWTMHQWHTALEPLTDNELMRELRSGDPARFRAACDELECRPFTQEHWRLYAAAAFDPSMSEAQRRYLPFLLYHRDENVAYADQMAEIFARTAGSDPQQRLFAAWSLSELAQIEPAREFDLLGVWRRGPQAADAEVEAVRAWWVANARPEYWKPALPPGTTQPADGAIAPP